MYKLNMFYNGKREYDECFKTLEEALTELKSHAGYDATFGSNSWTYNITKEKAND